MTCQSWQCVDRWPPMSRGLTWSTTTATPPPTWAGRSTSWTTLDRNPGGQALERPHTVSPRQSASSPALLPLSEPGKWQGNQWHSNHTIAVCLSGYKERQKLFYIIIGNQNATWSIWSFMPYSHQEIFTLIMFFVLTNYRRSLVYRRM